jgi:hypothetical protein
MLKDDIKEILQWLIEAAHLFQPPLENQPEVGTTYLLFQLLLKTHLSDKGQSQAYDEGAIVKMVGELVELGKAKSPALRLVGAVLFTCYESG